MSSYFETVILPLNAQSEAGKSREHVLTTLPWAPTPTTNVSYTASNRVLVIGVGADVEFAQAAINAPLEVFVFDPDDKRYNGAKLTGYLGRYALQVESADPDQSDSGNVGKAMGVANGFFDQVLDLGELPMIEAAIKPPGYYFAGGDRARLEEALAEIPELIGEFEKPKFFDYNPDICAHGRSGQKGCRRCIDACPTEAIISIGELIEVNPYLCQGGGSCTASCPSGAISYLYPKAQEQIEFLRQMIRDMRIQRDSRGVSLFIYDTENGADLVHNLDGLPEHFLPLEVEEIGSVGLDLLASALAYGANRIFLLVPESVSGQVKTSLLRDLTLMQGVLSDLSLSDYRVEQVIEPGLILDEVETEQKFDQVATYAGIGDKRSLIRSALEFFHALSAEKIDAVTLPSGSIFGEVGLNLEACTLCMGCVSVCPGKALEAGGESPALKFIEANCLQCGLCERACPESALTLNPRFLFDAVVAKRPRILKEEEPFRCISCNKPFATHAMIDRMTEKLTGHWMFEKPEALNRLRMCENCRVADMFNEGA